MAVINEPNPVLAWLKEKALPLWASIGWDQDADSFVERLCLRGVPLLNAPRRAMVQARQIYVYSVAHQYGWFPEGGELVARAVASMIRRYHEVDGADGWAFSVARDGAVVDGRRDLYTHAFILLGLAKAFETTQDRAYIALADDTLSFLDRHMTSMHGGFVESLPIGDGPRRQNPHMHLLEALLALFDATKKSVYLERARSARDFFFERILQSDGSIVVEFFDDEWGPLGGPDFSFEPGHHFEWMWLLDRSEDLLRFGQRNALARLWETALHGGVDVDGKIFARATLGGATDRSTRLWFYTEAAKAAHVMSLRREQFDGPSSGYFLNVMHDRFLAPAVAGSWIDEFDADGAIGVDFVPASSLYHICCAIRVLEDAVGR